MTNNTSTKHNSQFYANRAIQAPPGTCPTVQFNTQVWEVNLYPDNTDQLLQVSTE